MRTIILPDPTRRLLELGAVTALAIGQPVLADMAADPVTFVLRRSTSATISIFVVVVLAAPPMLAWALEEVARRVRPAALQPMHTVLLSMAALVWATQLAIAAGANVTVAIAGGSLVAVALAAKASRAPVRATLAVMAALVPALAVWFLLLSPVAELSLRPAAVPEGSVVPGEHPPIVLIIFDELPTLSLLDATGNIAEHRYPAFARLAATSTWYRNHTAMSPWTAYSVPTILTSTEPSSRLLPFASHHPSNLFSLLAPTYELHVLEPEWLCSPDLECNAPDVEGSGVPGLLRDAARLLGDRLADREVTTAAHGDPAALQVGEEELALDAPEVLDALVEGLGTSEQPRLDYAHVLAPHQPWNLLPDGRPHGAEVSEGASASGWSDDRAAEANRTRHLLQLEWTDAQLGRVLDRLEDLGTLDEALVVVTADHGAAFQGGSPLRASSASTLHEVYWAPLLVKLPEQREGVVIDAPVTSLDVLPTLLAAAGMPPRAGALGAALDPAPPIDRTGARRVWAGASTELEVDGRFATIDGDRGFAALLAAATLNPGAGALELHRQGPHGDLIGRRVEDLRTRRAPIGAQVQDPTRFEDVDPGADAPPAWVAVELPGGAPVELAIALNGVVAATPLARTDEEGRRAVALLPIELLLDGRNRVDVYVVERDRHGRRTLVGDAGG